MGQGIGLTNSAAFLIDEDGNDCYMTQDSLLGQGSSNWARGFGGMGLFVDLAGTDKYSQRNVATEHSFWTKGTYGSGLDYDRPASVENFEPDVDTGAAALDTAITAPVESVFKTASMWRVGNIVKKVELARKQLVKLGPKALKYVADKKMDTKDGLESEAIEALVKAWPDSSKPYLFHALRDSRYLARQNGAYFLGKLGRSAFDAVDSIYGRAQGQTNQSAPRRVRAWRHRRLAGRAEDSLPAQGHEVRAFADCDQRSLRQAEEPGGDSGPDTDPERPLCSPSGPRPRPGWWQSAGRAWNRCWRRPPSSSRWHSGMPRGLPARWPPRSTPRARKHCRSSAGLRSCRT